MATRTHGVFINTVGLLYASLGFSLSVLAALFGIFNRFINPPRARSFRARPHLPRKLRGPRTVRSNQSRKVAVPKPPEHLSIDKESTQDVKSLRRRSKSLIPIITIDHFGATIPPDFLEFLPKPALPAETSLPNPANTGGNTMDLSAMSRPKIKRRSSSPLVLPYATLPIPSSHDSLLVPSMKESKSSCVKMSRKTPSGADLNQETFTMKFDAVNLGKRNLSLCEHNRMEYFCTQPGLPIPYRGLRIPTATAKDGEVQLRHGY